MIEVANLRKEYGTLVAVDNVSFTAKPGEIFGLLGPNGAGKSTSMYFRSAAADLGQRPTTGRTGQEGPSKPRHRAPGVGALRGSERH